jgi:ParB-like chromosome segregation protein Spo0J
LSKRKIETISDGKEKEWEGIKDCKREEGFIQPNDKVEQYEHGKIHPEFFEGAYNELKESIRENGVIEPVNAYKEDSTIYIIDGWHRFKSCKELEIECPAKFYENLSDEAKMILSRDPNIFRRFYSKEDMKELVFAYHNTQWGYLRIANALGLTKPTVQRWIKQKESENNSKTENEVASDTSKAKPALRKAIVRFGRHQKTVHNLVSSLSESITLTKDGVNAGEKLTDDDKEKMNAFLKEIDELKSKAEEWKQTLHDLLGNGGTEIEDVGEISISDVNQFVKIFENDQI